jgi:hypothetical protein
MPKPRKGECKGNWVRDLDGENRFVCGYLGTIVTCDTCRYGLGRRDPAAKSATIPQEIRKRASEKADMQSNTHR